MNSSDVRQALSAYYTAPEWAILYEVTNATGARHTRYCDAVAMSLWPSRGLHLHGMEIKVSRYDWLSELKNPAKADVFYDLVDFFWLVTPEGIVKDGELPNNWGHIIVLPTGKLQFAKQATLEKAAPVSPVFLASLMRSMAGNAAAIAVQLADAERTAIQSEVTRRVDAELARRTPADYQRIKAQFDGLLSQLDMKDEGDRFWGWDDRMSQIGRCWRILQGCGIERMSNSLTWLLDMLESASADLSKGLIELGLTPLKPTKKGKRK